MKLAVLFERIGPYHNARLRAAARLGQIVAVEFVHKDETYSWDIVKSDGVYERITLYGDDSEAGASHATRRRIVDVFGQIRPDVVAIPGWSSRTALLFLDVCLVSGIPAVLMSETTWYDFQRKWVVERVKGRVLRLFSAALVGGSLQEEYLNRLGYPSMDFEGKMRRIFQGYDAVDNDFFEAGARCARESADSVREELGLPENYFLASGRFVEKKGHLDLIRAYGKYVKAANDGAWKLVLLGDGPLRERIVRAIRDEGLTDQVALPGFKQYHELPSYYGLAGAFIHPSITEQWGLVVNEAMAAGLPVIVSDRCGCAKDLVHEGVNGFTFAPGDTDALSQLMGKISANSFDRNYMGRASAKIIRNWSPDVFAENLWAAARVARMKQLPRYHRIDKMLMNILIRKMP